MVFYYTIYANINKQGGRMDKQLNNDLLVLGTIFLVIGLSVGSYSYSTYKEIKDLDTKLDFELIDNNNELSTQDKYYKYIAFADFLNQKLAKNKNIPMKNAACVYLDYAQHNTQELYKLTSRKMNMDESKKIIAAENVRSLYTTLDNYKTCKKSAIYKEELKNILVEIEQKQNLYSESQQQINDYPNNYKSIKNRIPTDSEEQQLPIETQNSNTIQQTPPQNMPENLEENYY